MIDHDTATALLSDMVRVRLMEEKCAELYSAAKIRGFLHLYVGEEAVAAGSLRVLEAEDAVVATYRDHAHALLRGVPMTKIMAEMFGKQEGCSRGRGGSMHLFDARTRFYGGNAIVGSGLPLAVGLALADKQLGRPQVTACYFGEGAVAEGAFHESLNLAELWQLPVLFCCENNLYAMGTAIAVEQSQTDMTAKAASYRIPALAVDGMDVLACHAAAQEAVVPRPQRRRSVLPGIPHISVPPAFDVRSRVVPRARAKSNTGRSVTRSAPSPSDAWHDGALTDDDIAAIRRSAERGTGRGGGVCRGRDLGARGGSRP